MDRMPPLVFVALVCVISWMWSRYLHPSGVVGEVEPLRANVITLDSGTLESVLVERFEPVTQGQPLAVVRLLGSEAFRAELDVIETDLRLLKARMDLDRTRNMDGYARARSDLWNEKINLAVAQVHLQQAESEWERVNRLWQMGEVVPESDLDVARAERDALQVEVRDRVQLVAQMEDDLVGLGIAGAARLDPVDETIERAIEAQQRRLELTGQQETLRSPIDGYVSEINYQPGEQVPAGASIIDLGIQESHYIVGWVRQPVTVRPRVGDVVEVRRPRLGQGVARARVVQVGSQLERISQTITAPRLAVNEVGLPFRMQVEGESDLIPGETVELRLISRAPAPPM